VKIINVDSYPDYVIVGRVAGPGGDLQEVSQIDKNTCLIKGYKYNQYAVYALEKNYFNSTSINDLDFGSSNAFKANIEIDPAGRYVPDSDPITSEAFSYMITGIKDGDLNLEQVTQNSSSNLNKNSSINSSLYPFEDSQSNKRKLYHVEQ
jgi:hypothetical protein